MTTRKVRVGGLLQKYAIRIGGGAILAIQAINHKDWLGLAFPIKVQLTLLSSLSLLVVICLVFAGVHIVELINWPSAKDVLKKINERIDQDELPPGKH